jgi:hypothetical protein
MTPTNAVTDGVCVCRPVEADTAATVAITSGTTIALFMVILESRESELHFPQLRFATALPIAATSRQKFRRPEAQKMVLIRFRGHVD